MNEPLRLGELASVAGFSPYHFHRLFHGMVGETIVDSVRRLRLTRAAWQLRSSPASVTEIALNASYETVEGFGRAFRQAYTMTPSKFRESISPPAFRPGNIRIDFRPESNTVRFINAIGDHGLLVNIETLPSQPAVLYRHVGPYENVHAGFVRLTNWVAEQDLFTADTKIMGLSYDDPEQVPPPDLRYDVCISTDELLSETPSDIRTEMLPGGRYAVYLHEGSYGGIPDAFQRLFGHWLPESCESLADRPCLEVHLNNSTDTPEAELRTKICIPLEDR